MVHIAYPFLISLAAALVVRDKAPQPLSFTLNKKSQPKLVHPHHPLGKSDPTANDSKVESNSSDQDVKIFADGDTYLIDLGVIDENQKLQVVLDTGSADLWVDAKQLKDTKGFTKNGQSFGIAYGDRSTVRGSFGTSSVWLDNGVEVKDLQWALATDVRLTSGYIPGILGVGKEINEAGYYSTHKTYPNFTQKLKDEGYIKSNSYSYYLNKLGTATGTVTFGGRDLAKVKGPVATITPSTSDDDARFDSITVSKISTSDGNSAGSVEAILDTGTTLTFLPYDTVNALSVPGVYADWSGTFYIESNPPSDKYVSYWFNDTEIKVSYADLAIPETDDNGNPTGRFIFGIQGSSGGTYILGDTFLRSAYITVNHDTNQVLISDVNYTDAENIVSI
ncbi:hypothetical protein DIURU_002190 [Diutina rugosa]|uniref:Peptidase A1 domain-containing protein n=1 Tax=Diutina rugosa TaxID=5481 RepID=A0A642UQW2_DIURU|nr:uncharacterized protein DIURU_002190 [Diutina rugosa]KAA8903679.1 hypothetical protein DIURU_002190 [Diutina rugosa]